MMEFSQYLTPSSSVFTYAWLAFALFAASCNGDSLDNALFRLNASTYNPTIKLLDDILTLVPIEGVFGAATFRPLGANDLMRETPFFMKGWRWSQQNPADESTDVWQPQGISTAHDTGFPNAIVHGNSDVLVVSWNDQRNITGASTEAGKGVRITFVRKGTADYIPENRAYVHALLVEPYVQDGEPNFRGLENAISGGIVWRGNWLFVTDQRAGVRVFDLDHIWKVKAGSIAVGKEGGEYWGGGHPYVIPQARIYTTALRKGVTFSPHSASLDRNSTPPCIILGESTPAGVNSTFAKFELDDDTNLFATDSSKSPLVTAKWAWETNIQNAEGIAFAGQRYFISSNDGDNFRGDLYQWQPGTWATTYTATFPPGVQGVCYKPVGDELWVVGSIPGKRYVMALSAGLKNITTTPDDPDPIRTNHPSATTASSPAPGGLASGIIAGIALGVLAGIGAVLVGILLQLKQRRQQAKSECDAQSAKGAFAKPELMDSDKRESRLYSPGAGAYVTGPCTGEMAAENDKYELPVKTERYELRVRRDSINELPLAPAATSPPPG